MKFLIVLPVSRHDLAVAENLLEWVEELGRHPENNLLLVRDCKLEEMQCVKLLATARRVFNAVEMITTPFSLPDERWPIGPNWMFETALRHLSKKPGCPAWLWLEPDCVPMRTSWLSELETAYARCQKLFMGQVVVPGRQGLPLKMLSGVAVYPGDARLLATLLRVVVQNKTRAAWDVAAADLLVPLSHHTKLIWNFIGEKDTPPTFVRKRRSEHPRNALEPSDIPPTCGLFHRCKDGSLIGLLRGDSDATIPQLLMALKLQTSIAKPHQAFQGSLNEPRRFWHAIERHVQRNDDAERRTLTAFRSWEKLYKQGRLKPAHVWEHEYPRDAKSLGDKRALPFLKDVLIPAMTKARDDDDVILWTNDDTILHPKVLEALEEKLARVDAVGSFRVNFDKIEPGIFETAPNTLAQRGKPDLGRDLFAFKKRWLVKRWFELPDFILGELEFDLVLAALIRRDAGVFTTKLNRDQLVSACEIERGYVLHENHERAWVSEGAKNSAAKMWNRDLAVKFYAERGFASLISNF